MSTPHRELVERLKQLAPQGQTPIYQGVVRHVVGILCTVEVAGLEIPDVRLRATESASETQILLVPKVGSAVLVGSLSGDLTALAVLSVDEVERIELHGKIVINDGRLGGMIAIDRLTAKLNEVIAAINAHVHTSAAPGTPTTPIAIRIPSLNASDYEDKQVTH